VSPGLPLQTYRFVLTWRAPHPIEQVWEELADLKSWPSGLKARLDGASR